LPATYCDSDKSGTIAEYDRSETIMRQAVVVGFVGLAFLMGFVAARAQSGEVTMRGTVKDANTLPEQIQYWEIRDREGASVIIEGPRNLPLIAWLKNARERRVVLTITSDESAVSP
jgi:hypothetical protein